MRSEEVLDFLFVARYAVDKWVDLPKGGNHSMLAQSPVLRGFELFKGFFFILFLLPATFASDSKETLQHIVKRKK